MLSFSELIDSCTSLHQHVPTCHPKFVQITMTRMLHVGVVLFKLKHAGTERNVGKVLGGLFKGVHLTSFVVALLVMKRSGS